jgi:hypothetical protein
MGQHLNKIGSKSPHGQKESTLIERSEQRFPKTKMANPLPKMIPGAVCAQSVRCGKKNCRCQSGDLHGPYFYYFFRKGGKLIKRYVRKTDVWRVRDACARYQDVERQRRNVMRAHLRQWTSFREELREAAVIIATRRKRQYV